MCNYGKYVSVPLWGELCGIDPEIKATQNGKEVSVPLWGELCRIVSEMLRHHASVRVSVPLWGELCGMVRVVNGSSRGNEPSFRPLVGRALWNIGIILKHVSRKSFRPLVGRALWNSIANKGPYFNMFSLINPLFFPLFFLRFRSEKSFPSPCGESSVEC